MEWGFQPQITVHCYQLRTKTGVYKAIVKLNQRKSDTFDRENFYISNMHKVKCFKGNPRKKMYKRT